MVDSEIPFINQQKKMRLLIRKNFQRRVKENHQVHLTMKDMNKNRKRKFIIRNGILKSDKFQIQYLFKKQRNVKMMW